MRGFIKHTLLHIVWFIVVFYNSIIILLHIPAVQEWVGERVQTTLSQKLGTKVLVERVDLGFLNRIIIDGFSIDDQRGRHLLRTARLSARIDILDLIDGKINISAAQIFGMKANIYKDNADSPYNFQFIIDSLASKDTTSTPINLRIASLVIRNGAVEYNQNDEPFSHGRFSPYHLSINNLSSHLMIYALKEDSVNIAVKHLSLAEQCGLNIKDFHFTLLATDKKAEIDEFSLTTTNSKVQLQPITVTFHKDTKGIDVKSLAFNGRTKNVRISPADLQPFIEGNVSNLPDVNISFSTEGSLSNAKGYLALNSTDKALAVSSYYKVRDLLKEMKWDLNDIKTHISQNFVDKTHKQLQTPEMLNRLGDISIKGSANGTLKSVNGQLNITTSKVGNAQVKGSYKDNKIDAHILAQQLDLNVITGSAEVGMLNGKIDGNAQLSGGNLSMANASVAINDIFAHGYQYHNINSTIAYKSQPSSSVKVAVSLKADDPNLICSIDGNLALVNNKISGINADIDMGNIVPSALRLTDEWGNSKFKFNSNITLQGSDINSVTGNLLINDFTIYGGHKSLKDITTFDAYTLQNLNLDIHKNINGTKSLSLVSDFMKADMQGKFNLSTIPSSFVRLISHYLSNIPGLSTPAPSHNNFSINASVSSTEFLHRMTGAELNIPNGGTLNGYINDDTGNSNIYCSIPKIDLGTQNMENLEMLVWTPEGSLNTTVKAVVGKEGKAPFKVEFRGKACNDELQSSIEWNNTSGMTFKGNIKTLAHFIKQVDGKPCVNVNITPSDIQLGDTIYRLHSKDIIYSDSHLSISDFNIGNDNQHLSIHGSVSDSPSDSIQADLKNVNIAYIMNLINFHSVEFGGYATGSVTAKSLFNKPDAYTHLLVKDFLFENGNLGTFDLTGRLNNKDNQIDVDGFILDDDKNQLDVKGFVSPQRDCIDLDLTLKNTNLNFLYTYCHSFMKDVEVNGNGKLRLYGPFSNINLTGKVVANGAFNVTTLNTRYTLSNDTINFVPDDMILNNQPLYDVYGHKALVSGGIHHKHLTKLTYDFDMKTDNFLCYDFKDFDGGVFYGTAFLSGECQLIGRSAELTVNVSGNIEEGSQVVYNASSPDAISQQEFITWGSANRLFNKNIAGYTASTAEEENDDVRTNIHMNFLVNITNKSLLRVIMDERAGDFIDLHGNGTLRATYYNKGSLQLFGNYNVDDGLYQMTIQKVIRRNFNFQQGGSITFGGDPFNATLNLQAKYTLNSVPLSDLNLGQSFSNNNIRVDCLMNIGGTAGAPKVEFDMDLPTVNSDVKQMIYSLINSEEEMNQQAIYLLSIGRFYAQSGNNAAAEENIKTNRTSQAMQSLLSGTLSQQLGNVLGSFMNSSKWTVGANISPGNEGFDNAEYEGIVNGSLLSNRLLINGQFGYRDNATTSQQGFIGDFDIRYLLVPSGNLALKMYNQTNDRYFTKNSLNTQGLGIIIKKDFNTWRELFQRKKKN